MNVSAGADWDAACLGHAAASIESDAVMAATIAAMPKLNSRLFMLVAFPLFGLFQTVMQYEEAQLLYLHALSSKPSESPTIFGCGRLFDKTTCHAACS